MYRVVTSFFVFVYNYMFSVFGSIFKRIFRCQLGKNSEKQESNSSAVYHQEDDHQIGSSCSHDSVIDKSNGEIENSNVREVASSVSTSKYEFLSGKGISGFIEEPKILSFTIHEVFVGSNNDAIINNNSILDPRGPIDSDFHEFGLEEVGFVKEKAEKAGDFVNSFAIEKLLEEQEQESSIDEKSQDEEEMVVVAGASDNEDFGEHELDAEKSQESAETLVIEEQDQLEALIEEKSPLKEEMAGLENRFEGKRDSSDQVQLFSKYYTFPCEEKEESICSNDYESVDSIPNEFLANRTISEGFEPKYAVFIEEGKVEHNQEQEEKAEYKQEPEEASMAGQSTDSDDDEYIELKPHNQNSISLDEETLLRENLSEIGDKHEWEDLVHEEVEPKTNDLEKSEVPGLQEKMSLANCDVQDGADIILEHQDIIEQLKMELKHARTGGLPTILEESESEELETPKIVQELKPLKTDEKFEHKDRIGEIQKVYKSYLDKMRKLDVLNFQTMHALGLLQLKDSVQLQTARKSPGPGIKSLLVQNLLSCKQGTAVVDPTKKIIADMNMDFEIVYVGHICLSWEILHWQYWKFQELQNQESQRFRQYNQVAGEFQLFQVLVQRFVENETFQGPRVQNYVKDRCVLRNLLQIPIVKEDSLKDKGRRGDDEDAITSQMLTEIVEESMQVFWEFLRTDKDESSMILEGHQQSRFNLQDFVDSELLMDIRNDFQKKEKKLKDMMRSRNCIVKRFQKHQEDWLHRALLVAQVELKLVWRVLKMSKLTADQLIWCHEKLDKISFCKRRVFVEPSFLLFPC